MNSFLLFVLLSSIAVVIHSKGQPRAAPYPGDIRNYSIDVKNEYMDILMNTKDTEEKFKKLREWGVKNGKEAEAIVENTIRKLTKLENEKASKTKDEKKKDESKKDTKKETKKA